MVGHRGQARRRGTPDHEGVRHHGRAGVSEPIQPLPTSRHAPGKSAKRVFALDNPGIHPLRKSLAKSMDCRVKPGNTARKRGERPYSIIQEQLKWPPKTLNFPETPSIA